MEMITAAKAAELLGVSITRVCDMIKEGLILGAIKTNRRHWRIPLSEVERLLAVDSGEFRRFSDAVQDGTVSMTNAAKALGLSRQRVHTMIKSGAFPGAAQRGRSGVWRIPMADLEAEIARRKGL